MLLVRASLVLFSVLSPVKVVCLLAVLRVLIRSWNGFATDEYSILIVFIPLTRSLIQSLTNSVRAIEIWGLGLSLRNLKAFSVYRLIQRFGWWLSAQSFLARDVRWWLPCSCWGDVWAKYLHLLSWTACVIAIHFGLNFGVCSHPQLVIQCLSLIAFADVSYFFVDFCIDSWGLVLQKDFLWSKNILWTGLIFARECLWPWF